MSSDGYDALADQIARETAKALSRGRRLRVGHEQAVLAHVEALVAGYGEDRAADFIGAIAENLGLIVLNDEHLLAGVEVETADAMVSNARNRERLAGFAEWARENYRPRRRA